jgi:hypothetical protein
VKSLIEPQWTKQRPQKRQLRADTVTMTILRKLSLAIKQDIAEEEAARRNTRKHGFSLSDHRRLLRLASVQRTIPLVPAKLVEQVDQLASDDSDWVEHSLINLRYKLGDDLMPEDAPSLLYMLIANAEDTEARADFHAWRARQQEMQAELAFGERRAPR